MISKTPVQRQAVLLVLHSDGYVEAFAERHVDCHFALMPHMTSPEGQRRAEELFELRLPLKYRRLYEPGNLRGAEQCRVIRPSDIARRDQDLRLLDAIDRIPEHWRQAS